MPSRFSDLLLQVLHQDQDLPEAKGLADMPESDWHAFVAEAIQYRLAFQLLEYLGGHPDREALAPPETVSILRHHVRATMMQNLRQQGRLRQMLAACHAEGIEVMLLKGLWLSEVVYRDIKARETGDIDLLFRPEDMLRATALFRRLGFAIPSDVSSLVDVSSACNEFPLTHPTSGSFFDVHWALTHPNKENPIDQEKLWRRSQLFSIAGIECRSLCLEDHLLYLCFHAVEHHRCVYVGPRALIDIARLVAQPPRPIDWDDVNARALELGWSRGAWLMLVLIRDHLGVLAPARTIEELRPHTAINAQIRSAAIESLFLDQHHRDRMADNLVRLIDEPSWQERLSLVARRLFPSREEIADYFQTQADAPGLYRLYVRRWRIMLKEHLPDLVQIIRGDPVRTSELNRTEVFKQWMGS